MPASLDPQTYGSKELFRFVRLKQPEVIDLSLRASQTEGVERLLAKPMEERRRWAQEWLRSDQVVRGHQDLSADYLAPLALERVPEEALPSRAVIADREAFEATRSQVASAQLEDRQRCVKTALAFKILNRTEEAEQASKLMQFVERFLCLDDADREKRYACAVLKRLLPKSSPKTSPGRDQGEMVRGAAKAEQKQELRSLARSIDVLWRARNTQLRGLRKQIDEARRDVLRSAAAPRPAASKAGGTALTVRQEHSARQARAEFAREYSVRTETAKKRLAALRRQYADALERADLSSTLEDDSKEFRESIRDMTAQEVHDMQTAAAATLGRYDIKAGRFCYAYEEVASLDDSLPTSPEGDLDAACFLENPSVNFENEVRVLGKAELIRVEERFLRYTPGEISYVENILAGELRRREVKSTRGFEQSQETLVEELTDTTSETSATTTQELHSEIASELNTRFDTDVSSSINASGGGSLGVVDLEGGAFVEAGLGLGVDTSLSTESSSDFSQEIVSRALERVRTTSTERRNSRSYSLYETLNLHELNNIGGESKNGVYCFLDKHVCITESVYGHRIFLLANIMAPAKNLVCEAVARRNIDLARLDPRPEFDITPNDIHPGTYKELVGRFRASNIQPPPSPTITIGRTYKTDTTTAVVEQQEFKPAKIAQLLVPFFERYKRFLITDDVDVPEGYRVRDVFVTVNHGSNGISVPAHLPLSVTAASIYTGAAVVQAGINPILMLPYGLWQIGFLASPLLHFNSDSSNVTVSIGNESQDSPYYFFPPDELIQQIIYTMSSFAALGPDVLDQVRELGNQLMTDLAENAGNVPDAVATAVQDVVNTITTSTGNVFSALLKWLNVFDGGDAAVEWNNLTQAVKNLGAVVDVSALRGVMGTFFVPLDTFINAALDILNSGVQSVISDLLSLLGKMFENSDVLVFNAAHGIKRQLPVSFNVIGVQPGVTINMNVCLERTEQALDRWRLETFGALYQAYLQQVAEYESQTYTDTAPRGLSKSPASLRDEEHRALKELVLHSLNNLHGEHGNAYTLERLNLLENGIDWKNMSYRLHRYGPNMDLVLFDKQGLLKGVDEKRRTFLAAHWAQALIPVQPDEHLEQRILAYMDSGQADLEGQLDDDRLAALYQDLILDRLSNAEVPEETHRKEVVPTDLIVLKTSDLDDMLPSNPNSPCAAE